MWPTTSLCLAFWATLVSAANAITPDMPNLALRAATTTLSSSSSSTSTSSSTNSEVAFLQVLQTAQISSMSCLITLVNMTTTNIGSCLDLTTLASLIVGDSANTNGTDFSSSLNNYLSSICSSTCADSDISEAQSQLNSQCSGASSQTALVRVLSAILYNYSSAYKTLACSVHFNGTSPLCLPSVLNSSSIADSYSFFDDLVAGVALDQYSNSVFLQAQCSGCMYEMYKAAVYTLPSIRSNNITTAMGTYLETNCSSSNNGGIPNWSDVTNQQIPDSLQVSQSTPSASKGSSSSSPPFTPIVITMFAWVGLTAGTMWIRFQDGVKDAGKMT